MWETPYSWTCMNPERPDCVTNSPRPPNTRAEQRPIEPDMRILPIERRQHADAAEVVRAVHDEYRFSWEPGGYHRDLYDIDGYYLSHDGGFWVLTEGDRVVGCVGVTLHGEECELHRLYLLRDYRGGGWGRRLLETALAHGRARGCRRMIAWSDVTLTDAHRLYRKAGFTQDGERICNDPDKSREFGFHKALT